MTNNVLWTSLDAAAATAGEPIGHWKATGVSIDSRTVEPGELFIALKGPNFDGHDYVADALARGAAAAMVQRRPTSLPANAPLLLVDDTTDGLMSLGVMGRLRMRGLVIAVTGSVGKTGTKEALRLALQDQAPTYATTGNLNNQLGVPLSLARMPASTSYGVFELGMNHANEITPISRQVKPHIAIITAIEAVHLENLGSIEAIADAKAEIFAGMTPSGVAILPRDSAHFPRLVAHARTQGLGRILSFGEHADADARLVECSLHATASAVSAVIRGEAIQYSLSAPGRHWVMNSLAVLLAAKVAGADLNAAARALAKISPLKGRGARTRIRMTKGGETGPVLVIDESYNASPASVAASVKVLAQVDLGDRGRRVAVLGDMLELGETAAALHLGLKPDLVGADVDLVFACGPNMRKLYETLPLGMRGGYAADSRALAPLVVQAVQPGDAVMVKGSLGSRMALVVETLMGLGEADRQSGAPRRAAGGN